MATKKAPMNEERSREQILRQARFIESAVKRGDFRAAERYAGRAYRLLQDRRERGW